MNVRLYRVILPVGDINLAAEFYGTLLSSPGDRVSPGRHYFDCGGTILACYDPIADGNDLGAGWHHHASQYCYFAVPDLEDIFERAKSLPCKAIDTAIAEMPWGERLFYANDPFGNPICFVDEQTLFTGS
jgi:predicted enzyme related to lactoylglutathione lyase